MTPPKILNQKQNLAVTAHARSSWDEQMNSRRWRPGKSAPRNREIIGRYPEGYFFVRWAPWVACYQATSTGDYLRNPDQWTDVAAKIGDAS